MTVESTREFLRKYMETMGWDDLNWLEDVHMGYEEGRAAVFDRNKHNHPPFPFHAYKLYFLCDLIGGSPAVSHETDAVDFFPEDALPPLSLTRVTPAIIAHLFEHHRHPEWPTSYD